MDKDLYNILETISGLVPEGGDAYVVGGTVRDMLLGRESTDVDIVVPGGARAFARDVARKLVGTAFVMDEARDVHRVTLRSGPFSQVDISPLKGGILDDLASRDFTINAMAVALSPGGGGPSKLFTLPPGEGGPSKSFTLPPGGGGAGVGGIPPSALIDPFGGLADLRARVVRALGEKAFTDDPLRLLRAFRLSVALGFTIEETTLALIGGLAGELSRVSPERIRDELYIILGAVGAEGVLRRMHAHGLLFAVLPEMAPMQGLEQGAAHAHDLLEHSLRAVGHCERVMDGLERYFGGSSAKLEEYLKRAADGCANIAVVVKLCALLHDVGKPSCLKVVDGVPRFFGHDETGALICESVAGRLRMSDKVRGLLSGTTRLHMRPLNLSEGEVTRRAVYRLVRDAGDALPALLLVSFSDALATREGPEQGVTDVEGAVRTLSGYYFGEYTEARESPLVKGGDLITELGVKPGPAIGRMLSDIEERRAEGLLKDRDGAIDYIRDNLGRYMEGD